MKNEKEVQNDRFAVRSTIIELKESVIKIKIEDQ